MVLDINIISLIIQEEKKRLERTEEYGEVAVVYDYADYTEREDPSKEEDTKRGVIVIDL